MAASTIQIPRVTPQAAIPLTGIHAAFEVVDITPTVDVSIGGFSLIALAKANGCYGRLSATILLIGSGTERIALVAIDLHAGSRYLSERIASCLPTRVGLGVDGILLLPSHTHAGPGGLYGIGTYDARAASSAGFYQELADAIADAVAHAITRASDRLDQSPARIGVGRAPVWGISANKSMAAFRANGVSLRDHTQRVALGQPIPTLTEDAYRAIDPRVTVIAATSRAAATLGQPLGMLAFFGAHPSAISPLRGLLSSESFGAAARQAAELLYLDGRYWPTDASGAQPRARVPVAFAISAGADVNVVHPELLPEDMGAACENDPAVSIPEAIGGPLARAALMAAERACQNAVESGAMTVRYLEATPSADARLSDEPQTGYVAAGASEFGRYFLALAKKSKLVDKVSIAVARDAAKTHPEGTTDPSPKDQRQTPKVLMDNGIFALMPKGVKQMLRGEMPEVVPLRVVDIGPLRLVTAPFEISVRLALAIEDAVLTPACPTTLIASCSGGYTSYATTEAEYQAQHYEGSSTLWGAKTGPWLLDAIVGLAGQTATATPTGSVSFNVKGAKPAKHAAVAKPAHAFSAKRKHALITGHWMARLCDQPAFSAGAWLAIDQLTDTGWEPLIAHGLAVDDRHFPVLIERGSTKKGLVRWNFHWKLPRNALHALQQAPSKVRLRLVPAAFTHGKNAYVAL